jgi:molecular chaperone DnaK (HSP70)
LDCIFFPIPPVCKEEIERMVTDTEKYKEEDEKQKDRIAAKNSLASFSFNMKSTVEDEKLKDKISEEDKKTISDKCEEVIKWLDDGWSTATAGSSSAWTSGTPSSTEVWHTSWWHATACTTSGLV